MDHSFLDINSVGVIGNFLPRKCGIATFTSDLVQSLKKHHKKCVTLAMNDRPGGYDYPPDVQFEIFKDRLSDYKTAADYLNTQNVDMALLQHEFGIFGGDSGEYILSLLEKLEMPVAITLHTVLTEPTRKQMQVMQRLADFTDSFIVMSKTAIEILHTLYDIPREKISFIPHGIPDMPFGDPNYYKERFDLLGRKVLLTFGLLSQNKGIEYVIKALPEAIGQFPDLTYVVLGATHPNVLESEGEKYRNHLKELVQKLDLEDHVVFKNQFVPFDELCKYISASDIYITPYIQPEQITSGTLAYAAGMGKAIISTRYWYAKEMLAEERGQLVPFKNEDAIADSIIKLLDDEALLHKMRKRVYDYNRNAVWKEVGKQYEDVFKDIRLEYNRNPRSQNASSVNSSNHYETNINLPRFNINHLEQLTDSTGLLQHAKYTIANRNHGYCTDDNARALLVALKAQKIFTITQKDAFRLKRLANNYLSFLLHAFNTETGRFYNFMSYSREWLEESAGSEDSHGRALWALGSTVALTGQSSDNSLAAKLFMRSLPVVDTFQSPRALAFTIKGIDAYLEVYSGDANARRIYTTLAERLFKQFKANSTDDWPWLEDILAYSNGKLPHALILAGNRLKRDDMSEMGLKSLRWLFEIQIENHHLTPIGNHGWYKRNSTKARFDQQPLEANALLEASIAAYQTEKKIYWLDKAKISFNWFLGQNDLNIPLYDSETGGCRDGLEADGVNHNEGAESTLAWMLSLLAMYELSDKQLSATPKLRNDIKANRDKELK